MKNICENDALLTRMCFLFETQRCTQSPFYPPLPATGWTVSRYITNMRWFFYVGKCDQTVVIEWKYPLILPPHCFILPTIPQWAMKTNVECVALSRGITENLLFLAAALHPDHCATFKRRQRCRWILFLDICLDQPSVSLSGCVQLTLHRVYRGNRGCGGVVSKILLKKVSIQVLVWVQSVQVSCLLPSARNWSQVT